MTLAKTWAKFKDQPLYLNSFYLMASTGVMAGFGFLYWLLAARLYAAADVGIAATLLSMMTYISMISQLGINAGIMRFLPQAKERAAKINTSLTFVLIASIVVSLIFLVAVNSLVPSLAFLSTNGLISVSFIVFMMVGAANVTLESVLIALRNGAAVLLKNGLLSVFKVGFLFLFLSFGAYGLFSSWALATIVAALCALVILASSYAYRPRPRIDYGDIREMAGYSLGNYLGTIVGILPQSMLPLLLTTLISPVATAYFNAAMSYAALLFSIPISICNSLLVEGATDEDKIRKNTLGAVKLIALILIPAIGVVLVFAQKALSLFGVEYSANAAQLLAMLALSSVFVAINTVCWTILNLQRRVKVILAVLTANALIVMTLCAILVGSGLSGIGAAWIIGQAVTSALYLAVLFVPRKRTAERRP